MTQQMDPVIYEQPVNEHMRVCLRLEHLFLQVLHWMRGASSWDSRAALAAIVEILNVLDRPDLKTKLVKELTRYISVLERFHSIPNIDRAKLLGVQTEIEHAVENLHSTQGRIAQALRDNDFLTIIRQHLLNPGGGCSFDVPAYHCWLQQPAEVRVDHLTAWFQELRMIQSVVALTLRLVRQSSAPQIHVAREGFYQASLDSSVSCQLVRVVVPPAWPFYPEISVGRHGVSIRFYRLDLNERPSQVSEDIKFQLTCCVF